MWVRMSDMTRRNDLSSRSKAARAKATAFIDRLKDQRAKDFMRTSVLHSLDDVDEFFLNNAARPSTDMWETVWLDSAELILSSTEQSFSKFEAQVSGYGGPENVMMLG